MFRGRWRRRLTSTAASASSLPPRWPSRAGRRTMPRTRCAASWKSSRPRKTAATRGSSVPPLLR
ncbi:hypothetical protein GH5_08376 [Leishmania sp. Ghana 2012 LV757]|uniref:hypothetical protein n=1 Tax=Leishmania sp. Ghana 2012 LV757 TaxID=2803181 RepID=UPI001B436091|nr:hypothetical protein GH5_08376 [Leishmania sp. Ghana 2012 LV757]